MSEQSSNPIDFALTQPQPSIEQQETPHGVLRTFFYAGNDNALRVYCRYDLARMIFVFIHGKHASILGEAMRDWLWENFPALEMNEQTFSELSYEYLQTQARQLVPPTKDTHALVIGAISRESEEGYVWLSWLGTSGVRLLDGRRNPISIEMGLYPGEGWSSDDGVSPLHARPHTISSVLNPINRILIFSSGLRDYVEELPHLGRVALARIAESASEEHGAALLFDLYPQAVVESPDQVIIRYRWDSPYEATLRWNKPRHVSGYRVEQASTLSFTDAEILAEMMDARQLLYRVQPPTDREVYYRIVPFHNNMVGVPSSPVRVTPVGLVAPVLESMHWTSAGQMLARWSTVLQADRYELEASPEFDFDSPQNEIVYSGSDNFAEFDLEHRGGWYFRIRSLNVVFAPNDASPWSHPVQAPRRLQTPQFESVTAEKVSWFPVQGATLYEVRRVLSKTDFKLLTTVKAPYFTPPKGQRGLYEVRALRVEGEEKTASLWSSEISIGGWFGEDEGTTETVDTEEVEFSPTKPKKLADSDTYEFPVGYQGLRWPVVAGIAGVVLFLGLVIGLLGEQRFGVLSDPTVTPVPQSDLDATSTQSSFERFEVTEQFSRAERLQIQIDEQSNTLAERAVSISTLEAELENAKNDKATLDVQIKELETQLTTASNDTAKLESQLETLRQAQIDASAIIESLTQEIDGARSDYNLLATQMAESNIALKDAHATATQYVENANATATQNVLEFQATVQAQQTLVESQRQTIEAPTPTPTYTPTMTPPSIFGRR